MRRFPGIPFFTRRSGKRTPFMRPHRPVTSSPVSMEYRTQVLTPVGSGKKLTPVVRVLIAIPVIIAALHLVFVLVTSSFCLLYRFVNPPVSSLMLYRTVFHGNPLGRVEFVPIRTMPGAVSRMFVSLEDSKFWTHPGIDLEAILRAREINSLRGGIVVGGSTITQQISRTLFLTTDRTYLRKYLEAIIALEMDLVMPKERILELYLNYIEWGKGVYGIGAASRHHYGKSFSRLTRDEQIRLAVIITSPVRYNVKTYTKNAAMRERYAYLTRRFGAGQSAPAPAAVLQAEAAEKPDSGQEAAGEPGAQNPGVEVRASVSETRPEPGAGDTGDTGPAATDAPVAEAGTVTPSAGNTAPAEPGAVPPAE